MKKLGVAFSLFSFCLMFPYLAQASIGKLAASLSPDGRFLVEESYKRLELYDLATGSLSQILELPSLREPVVHVSPLGGNFRFLLLVGEGMESGYSLVLTEGRLQFTRLNISLQGYLPRTLSVSSDGRYVALTLIDRYGRTRLRVHDLDSGKEISIGQLPEFFELQEFTFGGHSHVLLVSDGDQGSLYDLRSGQKIGTMGNERNPFGSGALWDSKQSLWVTKSDGFIRLWNSETGNIEREAPFPEPVTGDRNCERRTINLSAEKTRLFVTTGCQEAAIIDLLSLAPIRRFPVYQNVADAALSPQGDRVFTRVGDGALRLWDADSGSLLATVPIAREEYQDVVFSQDETLVAATVNPTSEVRIYELATGKLVHTIRGHLGPIHGIAFSAANDMVLTGSSDGTAKVWRLSDGSLVESFDAHDGPVRSVGFSDYDHSVVTASEDGFFRIFDRATGAVVRKLRSGGYSGSYSMTISPNGSSLAVANWQSIAISTDSQQGSLKEIATQRSPSIAWSADSNTLFYLEHDFKKHKNSVWSFSRSGGNPKRMGNLPTADEVHGVLIPEAGLLATSNFSGLDMYDFLKGKLLWQYPDSICGVIPETIAVAFGARTHRIAVGHQVSCGISLLDPKNGKETSILGWTPDCRVCTR